ncbi:hypothetical protein HC823_00925, partial [Candidatus Gracilibacteria bacterium]|nr:hypothetical protein [Candidatus Gracilibacteria bacterium]
MSATDPVPQKVEVTLKNADGGVITSDFETEVELNPSSVEAIDFFRVQPGQKIKVNQGVAKFFLVPKGADHGGSFSLTFEAGGKSSAPLPVSIKTQELSLFSLETEATVGQKKPIVSGSPCPKYGWGTGSGLGWEISSIGFGLGDISNGGEVELAEGVAKIYFYPGKKA